ncbi:hypothetical protein [Paenibacillus anseongense]
MRLSAASTDAPRPKLRSRSLVASFIIFEGLAALLLGLAVSVSVGAADN